MEPSVSLSYRWEGGLSQYESTSVDILDSGQVKVSIQKRSKPISYQTTLSDTEQKTLSSLITSTDFFGQPEEDTTFATDTGLSEISVKRGRESRTLRFRHRPALAPLSQFLRKLITQADSVSSLEADEDIYTAISAVNERHAGMEVLQPDRLKDPIVSYIKRSDNRQRVEWCLEGLAWILSPEDFADVVAEEMLKENRRDLILSSIPLSGNLPESHWQALQPVFFTFVRDNAPRKDDLNPTQRYAYDRFVKALGEARYQKALPLFITWFKQCHQSTPTPDITPIARMGTAGLKALLPFLNSPDPRQRSNAIELMVSAARGSPNGGYSNPYPASEYEMMIPVFQDVILPRLAIMEVEDFSPHVREKAKIAREKIPSFTSR